MGSFSLGWKSALRGRFISLKMDCQEYEDFFTADRDEKIKSAEAEVQRCKANQYRLFRDYQRLQSELNSFLCLEREGQQLSVPQLLVKRAVEESMEIFNSLYMGSLIRVRAAELRLRARKDNL